MENRLHSGPADTPERAEIDGGWIGVDMVSSPELVARDKMCFARNKRFDKRTAAPRKGMRQVYWAGIQGFGGDDPLDAIPLSTINGYNWIFIMFRHGGYIWNTGVPVSAIDLASYPSFPLPSPARVVQANNQVYLFFDSDSAPRVWTPGSTPNAMNNGGFQAVPAADTYEDIPNGTQGVWLNNRLWVAYDGHKVWPSEVLDPSDYQTSSVLNVESGAHDRIVKLYPLGKDLIVFKEASIYALTNATGPIANVVTEVLSQEMGLKAEKTVAKVGNELWFLADEGVMKLSQVLDNRLQSVQATVSYEVQPLFDLINWEYASNAQAAYWDGKYYLAVPLNGSTNNNAVLVYDVNLGAWQGFDQAECLDVTAWIKVPYQGRERLFFLRSDGKIFLYEEGDEDYHVGEYAAIEDEAVTRGYLCQDDQQKVFQTGQLALAAANPDIGVHTIVNGNYREENA